MQREKLGELLVSRNYITPEQLEQALMHQEENGGKIGRSLVRMGAISEITLYQTLAEQFGVNFVTLGADNVDEAFIRMYPEHLIRKYKFIPLSDMGGILDIAFAEPKDLEALDDISVTVDRKVNVSLAMERDIEQVINHIYEQGKVLKELSGIETSDTQDGVYFDLEKSNQEDAPVKQVLNDILRRALAERASDIHLKVNANNMTVKFRIDGVLHNIMTIPKQAHSALTSRIKHMSGLNIAEKRVPQDGKAQARVDDRMIDLRVSTLPTVSLSSSQELEKVAIRLLDKSSLITKTEKIGFSPEVLAQYNGVIRSPYGVVLITGPTGSGKSSTLYTTVMEINDDSKNIITIEDPVEYELDTITQVQVNPKTGLTFAAGLRSILRQDPDIVLLGEIRDNETAEIAVRAANTGHLVLSTLHTNDAPSAIMRLMDMGVEPFLIASSLNAVVGQRLVRKLCEHCKEEYRCDGHTNDKTFFGLGEEPVTLYRGKGCRMCKHTGFRGRIPIHELLVVDNDIRRLIMSDLNTEKIKRSAISHGMKTMKEDGLLKALQGLTTLEEIRKNVSLGGED